LMSKTGRIHTTINVDRKMWSEFLAFVIAKEGTQRKASKHVEKAIQLYLKAEKEGLASSNIRF